MKEFIDKLIERLEEKRKFLENTYLLSKKSYEVKKDAVARINELGGAIQIVNELAEEFAPDIYVGTKVQEMPTGWIPCSERLPDKSGKYIATQERYSVDDRFHTGRKRIEVDFVQFDANNNTWSRAKFFDIIAWMPLPAPYTEGE